MHRFQGNGGGQPTPGSATKETHLEQNVGRIQFNQIGKVPGMGTKKRVRVGLATVGGTVPVGKVVPTQR